MVTRPRLDAAYLDGIISQEEYAEILEASGWTKRGAFEQLQALHASQAPEWFPAIVPPAAELDRERVTRPGRRPTRAAKDEPRLTGHPLDEDE